MNYAHYPELVSNHWHSIIDCEVQTKQDADGAFVEFIKDKWNYQNVGDLITVYCVYMFLTIQVKSEMMFWWSKILLHANPYHRGGLHLGFAQVSASWPRYYRFWEGQVILNLSSVLSHSKKQSKYGSRICLFLLSEKLKKIL